MRFPWQGLHVLEASAPSAGVCHRCVTHLPGARVAERSDALGAVEIVRMACTAARTLARERGPAEPGRGRAQTATATHATDLSRHFV